MSKIKVLVVPSDRSGVGKFRSVDPHIFLQNQYPDEFHVDIVYEPPYEDVNFWTQYQIVPLTLPRRNLWRKPLPGRTDPTCPPTGSRGKGRA